MKEVVDVRIPNVRENNFQIAKSRTSYTMKPGFLLFHATVIPNAPIDSSARNTLMQKWNALDSAIMTWQYVEDYGAAKYVHRLLHFETDILGFETHF